MILRRIARPLLAAVFVADGLRALRDPRGEFEALPGAATALDELAERLPYVPASGTALVRGIGLVKVAAATALGLGVAPRAAAGVLAVLQVPTILAQHPVWTGSAGERRTHLDGLLRDTAVLGGLLLAAADTAGKPSLAWRLEAARASGSRSAARLGREAKKDLARTVEKVERKAERAGREMARRAEHVAKQVEKQVEAVLA